jgi:hypothetical protein
MILELPISHQGTKAQRRNMNYKTLSKREESIAEKLKMQHIPFVKNGIK